MIFLAIVIEYYYSHYFFLHYSVEVQHFHDVVRTVLLNHSGVTTSGQQICSVRLQAAINCSNFVFISDVHVFRLSKPFSSTEGGLETAFDLAAFRLSMIAPVKKSVNHSRTVASMRETGWEQH